MKFFIFQVIFVEQKKADYILEMGQKRMHFMILNSRILLLKLGRSKCTVNPLLDQSEWKLETAMFHGTPCFNLKTKSSRGGAGGVFVKGKIRFHGTPVIKL